MALDPAIWIYSSHLVRTNYLVPDDAAARVQFYYKSLCKGNKSTGIIPVQILIYEGFGDKSKSLFCVINQIILMHEIRDRGSIIAQLVYPGVFIDTDFLETDFLINMLSTLVF